MELGSISLPFFDLQGGTTTMGGNQMGSAPPPMVLRSLFHQYSTSTKLVPFYYTSQQCIEGEGNEGDGLRLCSQAGCGRPKIRRHKFRRCSIASVEDDGKLPRTPSKHRQDLNESRFELLNWIQGLKPNWRSKFGTQVQVYCNERCSKHVQECDIVSYTWSGVCQSSSKRRSFLLPRKYNSKAPRNVKGPAKVRQLYDIANVLASMNLIEKTYQTESRKPTYNWLGFEGRSPTGSHDKERKHLKRNQELKSLPSSYHLQYHNQAISRAMKELKVLLFTYTEYVRRKGITVILL
ncbi:hypothetical protein MRB53_006261 [Persea americana]|uniref:Uncharacterized protein n=1 Tax=Persea americana TaxID=3435 RepID=A0ACC2MFX7_PERAE|nr:hypothetical protein MRB53_006261 [Persea americana]